MLGVLFGPVAGWSGVQLPQTLEAVEALRWPGGGGDAAPWIHLIALSLACYVVVPRLLLAGLATVALAWLGRAKALPDGLQPYAAGVFRGGGHVRAGGVTSVTPYAYEPSDASLAGLERWLASVTRGRRAHRPSHLAPLRRGGHGRRGLRFRRASRGRPARRADEPRGHAGGREPRRRDRRRTRFGAPRATARGRARGGGRIAVRRAAGGRRVARPAARGAASAVA